MITKVVIPKLSANVEEGVITAWLKNEGDAVKKGDPLVEITTEKAAFELEAPRSGTLRQILASEKSALPVGYVIALLGKLDDVLPDVTGQNDKLLAKRRISLGTVRKRPSVRSGKRIRVRATPAARRLAKQHELDLAEVQKVGGVEVVNEDTVRQYLEQVDDRD